MELTIEANRVQRASAVDVPEHASMPALLEQRAMRSPNNPIILRKASLGDTWIDISARQFVTQMKELAAGLFATGLKKGDVIGILSPTCYEWTLLDIAAQACNIITVPIYETDSPSQVKWLIEDSQITAVFCYSQAHEALINNISECTTYVFEEDCISYLIDRGRKVPSDIIDDSIHSIEPDDLATIVYTSGTTGRPRGVRLTHRNITANTLQAACLFPEAVKPQSVRLLLFLPLAHIYARQASYMALLGEGVCAHVPDTKNLLNDMATFQPTTIGAVPRVLEKIFSAADAKAGKGMKKRIFKWSVNIAESVALANETQEPVSKWLRFRYWVASKLVLNKIKDLMGGKMKCVVSGGAPLSAKIQRFFTGAGLYVYQGYGLTEASGGCVCNSMDKARAGSIGTPIPGATICVDDDGEILIDCVGIFDGYHNNPKETQASLTKEGWLRTGDLGYIDEDGFIFVTGRKKELIVTSSGKNVQPAVLEDSLRSHPLISQIIVLGNERPFISALVTLDADMLPNWLANHKLPDMTVIEASTHPDIRASITAAITKANKQVSRAESIRKFSILKTDFTEENGLLTPSLKVKRKSVVKRFSEEINKLYS
ncbi:MAG: AMP-dependent synthetase/ligase [Actinomycetaceae bacterium]|nr:AMP-dependent synthetase/ligase [Actinomycetaceae bacterium]